VAGVEHISRMCKRAAKTTAGKKCSEIWSLPMCFWLDRWWSAKVEYDYLGFGPQAMNFTTPT
jgi:hypothetical protein